MQNESKWALVTGASSGIGRSTAEKLADLGYSLVLLARRTEKLTVLAELLESRHQGNIKVLIDCVDLRDREAILNFVNDKKTWLEKIDVLVNNAGLARGIEKMQDAPLKDWADMIDTNVTGLLWLTRGVLPLMIRQNRGHIVNVGSVAGRWVYPGGGVYCATKFAVRAISEGLRMDLLGTSIRVTNVEPGMVNTEFSAVRFGDQVKAQKVYEGMRSLEAEDVAETVIWCLQRPSHVNVQEIVIFPTDQAAVGHVYRKG